MALSRINCESSLALSHLMEGGPNTVCTGDASRASRLVQWSRSGWFLAILIRSAL